jgi:hypothetical protein
MIKAGSPGQFSSRCGARNNPVSAVSGDTWLVPEAFSNSSPEGFVLSVETPTAGWAGDGFSGADELVGGELLSGQVQFQSVTETVPPVAIDPFAVAVNLSPHEDPTEEIVEDESRGPALTSCRVVGAPVGNVLRSTGVRTPRSPNRTLHLDQRPEDHAMQHPEAHRILLPGLLPRTCARTLANLPSASTALRR